MFKKLALAAVLAATSFGSTVAFTTVASAGEGHWSIGNGIQCRLINGVVVCSKARP
jgi:hypothetical protein